MSAMFRLSPLMQCHLGMRASRVPHIQHNMSRRILQRTRTSSMRHSNTFIAPFITSAIINQRQSPKSQPHNHQPKQPNQQFRFQSSYNSHHFQELQKSRSIAARYRIAQTVTILTIVFCCSTYYLSYLAQNPTTPTAQLILPYILTKNRTSRQFYEENLICSRANERAGRWWVLLTSTIAHGNLIHLGMNSYFLWQIGPTVILSLGFPGAVAIWMLAGAGSSMPYIYWPSLRKHVPVSVRGPIENFFQLVEDRGAVGASGALCGLYAALGPTSGLAFVAAFDLGCLATGVLPNVGHTAHLSGMAIGLASWAVWFGRARRGRW